MCLGLRACTGVPPYQCKPLLTLFIFICFVCLWTCTCSCLSLQVSFVCVVYFARTLGKLAIHSSLVGLPQSGSEPRSGPEPRRTGPRSGPRFGIVTKLDLQNSGVWPNLANLSGPGPNRQTGKLAALRPETGVSTAGFWGVNRAGSPRHHVPWLRLALV